MSNEVCAEGVREYGEGFPVTIGESNGRECVMAANENGHNGTSVDLLDLVAWLKTHRPELLK